LSLDVRQLSKAEVKDLDASVAGQEEVLGLQISVDDSFLVRGGEAMRDLECVIDRPPRRELSTAENHA
jgi:hypothetical protein